MTSLTKNPQPPTKNFFWVQTRRLAESFEPLNRSLAFSAPDLRSCKATCDPFFWCEIFEHYWTRKHLSEKWKSTLKNQQISLWTSLKIFWKTILQSFGLGWQFLYTVSLFNVFVSFSTHLWTYLLLFWLFSGLVSQTMSEIHLPTPHKMCDKMCYSALSVNVASAVQELSQKSGWNVKNQLLRSLKGFKNCWEMQRSCLGAACSPWNRGWNTALRSLSLIFLCCAHSCFGMLHFHECCGSGFSIIV